MNKFVLLVLIYFLCMNLFGFLSMFIDKRLAVREKRRISERALFTFALLGGSLGSILGMKSFHHKTQHWYFKYGMPLILALQLALAAFLVIKAHQ